MTTMFSRCRTVAPACVAAFLLFADSAHATVVTYDFGGTLSHALNGGTSVTLGEFVVDNVADTITNFSFATPFGSATPSNYVADVNQFLPAVQPNADFTQFIFHPDNFARDPLIILLFESSLANFNGGSLYTAGVMISAFGITVSEVGCDSCQPPRLPPLVSGFASGTATPEPVPTTPLPAALPLFATGLGALGLLGWRRKRKARASLLGEA